MNLNYGYNSIMTTITAVDLRENLNEIIQRAANGEEVLISYRGQTLTKIVPTKSTRGNGADILAFFKENAIKHKSKKLSQLAIQTPEEDKSMIHDHWDNKYFNN
jgi:prevent-host-death family protein